MYLEIWAHFKCDSACVVTSNGKLVVEEEQVWLSQQIRKRIENINEAQKWKIENWSSQK